MFSIRGMGLVVPQLTPCWILDLFFVNPCHKKICTYCANDLRFWLRWWKAHILRSFDGSWLMAIKWLQFEESFDGILLKGVQEKKTWQSVTDRSWSTFFQSKIPLRLMVDVNKTDSPWQPPPVTGAPKYVLKAGSRGSKSWKIHHAMGLFNGA